MKASRTTQRFEDTPHFVISVNGKFAILRGYGVSWTEEPVLVRNLDSLRYLRRLMVYQSEDWIFQPLPISVLKDGVLTDYDNPEAFKKVACFIKAVPPLRNNQIIYQYDSWAFVEDWFTNNPGKPRYFVRLKEKLYGADLAALREIANVLTSHSHSRNGGGRRMFMVPDTKDFVWMKVAGYEMDTAFDFEENRMMEI